MGTELIPPHLHEKYRIYEWKHACAILANDYPQEWQEILANLEAFELKRSEIVAKGGRKSSIASRLDQFLYDRDWVEKKFDIKMAIDGDSIETPTHKIDCFKNKVGVEIEWNNKDPFFDRDLNNFRLLFELRALSIGVIITRDDELQDIFNALDKGSSYGNSTTHWSKLIPRIEGGGSGGCPVLVFAIKSALYNDSE